MWIHQIFIVSLCTLLVLQRTQAVVNSGQTLHNVVEDTSSNTETAASTPHKDNNGVADLVASATSDQEANRRDAALAELGNNYGPPVVPHQNYGPPPDNMYIPSAESNPGLPVPVYGAPDAPGNSVVYPGLPPDIPPALHASFNSLHDNYGPPKEVYGQPKEFYSPPPRDHYGPPLLKYGPSRPHKPFHPPPSFHKPPKHHYGPPRPQYGPPPKLHFGGPKLPKPHYGAPFKSFHGPPSKPIYGPPKPIYGPPKQHGPPHPLAPALYGPPLQDNYGPPKQHGSPYPLTPALYGPPLQDNYGPPKQHGPPYPLPPALYVPPLQDNYGPPKQHGPPHPLPPALYGPPLQDNYGPPKQHGPPPHVHHHYGPPDPVPHGPPHPGAPAPPTPPDIKYDGWQPIPGLVSRPPSDSYGVPHGQPYSLGDLQLNGDFVPPPAADQEHGVQSLSLGTSYGSSAGISDSYGAPLNTVTGSGGVVSTSGDAHINNQDQNAISLGLSAAGIEAGHENALSVIKSIGYEIHPIGGYDVLSGNVGNHISGPLDTYGASTINLYSSGGGNVASSGHSYKSFGKGISLSTNGIGLIPPSGFYGVVPSGHYGTPLLTPPSPPKRPISFRDQAPGPSYIPQHISDGGNQLNEESPILTNIYTLPSTNNAISFQNIAHGPSLGGAQAHALTSYNVPLSVVDNMYGIPGGVGVDHSLPGTHIDLTRINVGNSIGSASYAVPQFNVPHDCNMYKSQLSYGMPSSSSYTASLSSLHTNLGGDPSGLYGSPDLQAAHSQLSNGAVLNEIVDDKSKEMHGKSLVENFALDSELIKSDSIDFNNIPIQGSMGSYTLQIQPADGLGTTAQGMQVQHDQVLNDGLLQSILAAIEQPHQKNAQILGQPLLNFQPGSDEPSDYGKDDGETQNSVKNPVVIPSPIERITNIGSYDAGNNESDNDEEQTTDSMQLLDNNEIALYFSNTIADKSVKAESDVNTSNNIVEYNNNNKDSMDLDDSGDAWNGQQFGSYVSFNTKNTSYAYGDRIMSSQEPTSSTAAEASIVTADIVTVTDDAGTSDTSADTKN